MKASASRSRGFLALCRMRSKRSTSNWRSSGDICLSISGMPRRRRYGEPEKGSKRCAAKKKGAGFAAGAPKGDAWSVLFLLVAHLEARRREVHRKRRDEA